MTGDAHLAELASWLGGRTFPQRIWLLQPGDAIRAIQGVVYRDYFCAVRMGDGAGLVDDDDRADGAEESGWPGDHAGFRSITVHRLGPSAVPDHEWVTSGDVCYRAPIAFLDPRDALARQDGPARMAIPVSLSRLGWRHYYGTSLPSRAFPPVVRLYLGVPASARRELWNALWPLLRDAVPVLEAKVLAAGYLTRNDSVVLYVPVEAACLVDTLVRQSLAACPVRPTRPPLTLRMPSGAGLAQSPAAESYGQRRARQIARCYVAAKGDVPSTVEAFAAELGQDGASGDRPWACGPDFGGWLARCGVRC